MKKNSILIASLAFLGAAVAGNADETKWSPYVGAETGVDLVSTVTTGKSTDEAGTCDISLKPGAAFGLEGGFTHGSLSLGVELRYSQAKLDTLTWYDSEGVSYDKLPATDGQLRQLTLAPTIGYRLFSNGKLAVAGQLTAGWLRREFSDVKHDDAENSTENVLDDAKSTWLIKPSVVLSYALGEHSSIKLRYAYAFSGKTTATDLTVADDDEDNNRNPDIAAIKTHSLSLGYNYQF